MNELNSSAGELLHAQIGNAITAIKLQEFEGEPLARDVDIGKRLGFARARDIRPLIEKHYGTLEEFGAVHRRANSIASGKGRQQDVDEYWLNEAQALYIGAKSEAPNSTAVLTMLINVFVAWRHGHLVPSATAALPADVMEMIRRDDGISRMLSHKVTGIEATVAAMNNALVTLLDRVSPNAPSVIVREGMTAGQIWRVHGFPPLRSTAWFGNRLTEMGCALGGARGQLGDHRARLFDPDKAAEWLKAGGRALVEGYVKERAGQGKLEGV